MTPFDVLGVTPDAPPDDIRSAYRHLVFELHPDTRSPDIDPAIADEALRRVQEAWDVISSGSVPRQPPRDEVHTPLRRFPWWVVAIAVMMAIFVVTAYAGSVPVNAP